MLGVCFGLIVNMNCLLRPIYKFFYPHNKIVLPSPNEWCDKDHKLLEACFTLLVDFITEECARMYFLSFPKEAPLFFFWVSDKKREEWGLEYLLMGLEEQTEERQEYTHKLVELYHWWVYERDLEQDISYELGAMDYMNKEYALYLRDSDRLKELISIREIMWT